MNTSVKIISLYANSIAYRNANQFGFTNVVEELNKTVDLRNYDVNKLFSENLVTEESYISLMDGQRRSYEFPNSAAVGCFLSHMKICSQNESTLVLEEDAVFQKSLSIQLKHAIELIQKKNAKIIIFGPSRIFEGLFPWRHPVAPYNNTNRFEKLGTRGFWGTHGVLYSAKGCIQMNNLFKGPKNMQIDSAISYYSQISALKDIWIEINESSIVQDWSLKTVFKQHINSQCCYCNTSTQNCFPYISLTITSFVSVIVTVFINNKITRKFSNESIKLCSVLLLIVQNINYVLKKVHAHLFLFLNIVKKK